MKARVKIDWDTVELISVLVPAPTAASSPSTLVSLPQRLQRLQRPHRSIVKLILSGGSQKARTRGAIYTHTQLRKLIPPGLEMLIYGWRLVAAAIESDRDFSRAVELAALAILETSHRFAPR